MALEEKTSKHLGVKYVYLPDKKLFLCENGVLFSLEEYKKGIDLEQEYRRRKNENTLYDYAYARSTGQLRKKRGQFTKQTEKQVSDNTERTASGENSFKQDESEQKRSEENLQRTWLQLNKERSKGKAESGNNSVMFIVILLAFTSVISGYISTLHTATYLYDYVDIISAWLMSASVTAYNVTAFEVSVLFKNKHRFILSVIFMFLWAVVTLFSMLTTVSVFYDRFNFTETQIAEENKEADANKLALYLLRTKEKDLREAIDFKKKDIQYRQERDYATTAVRTELVKLEEDLQENLTQQEELLKATPEVAEEKLQKKESLFSFLGRLLKIEGGILEFIMSTLSAIFVNLIAPLSLSAVIELSKKKLDKVN